MFQRVLCLACVLAAVVMFAQAAESRTPRIPQGEAPQRHITVDGDAADWKGIRANRVKGAGHLWFGQGMTRERWKDNRDLSYAWRAAWAGDRLFFLFEVADDRVMPTLQPSSYLNDCIEIYFDPANAGGRRVRVLDGRPDWFTRWDPAEMAGYELHFLPAEAPRVYLDHRTKYATESNHNAIFARDWKGEVACRRTKTGYVMEIGLTPPGVTLRPGLALGLETGVCDDDGSGRESIMMWTGTKADFWVTMDGYGKLTLGGAKP